MDSRALKNRAIEKHRKQVAELQDEIRLLKMFHSMVGYINDSKLIPAAIVGDPTNRVLFGMLETEMQDLLDHYNQYKFQQRARKKGVGLKRKIERKMP